MFAFISQDGRKTHPRSEGAWMFGADDFFVQVAHLAIQRFGFSEFSLIHERLAEIVAADKCIGMVRPEHFLAQPQNISRLGLGLRVLGLTTQGVNQTVPAIERAGMLRPESVRPRLDRAAKHRFRIAIFPSAMSKSAISC